MPIRGWTGMMLLSPAPLVTERIERRRRLEVVKMVKLERARGIGR
jgi:hypothetical protein